MKAPLCLAMMLACANAPASETRCPASDAGSALTVVRGSGDTLALATSFDRSSASGDMRLFAGAIAAASFDVTPAWDASDILTGHPDARPPLAGRPSPAQRQIFTLAHQAGRSTTVPFQWDALPGALRALLERPDGLGQARTAYLRGDRTGEIGHDGGRFRRRTSVLGDIVHSTPLLVGLPSVAVSGPGYDTFLARYAARRKAIYVGANDGMLHAFDRSDGVELFAYVPNALIGSLSALSSPGYAAHALVDGAPAAAEVCVNEQWRTVLASGMGMGARGLFALDVSDPGAFGAGLGALWEFTAADDAAIGNIDTPPRLVKLKTGGTAAAPVFRYFAAASSGASLFLMALDKAPSQAWRAGVNYYKLSTPTAGGQGALGAATFALAPDGSARYAYAGDASGNLWRFDLSAGPPWTNAIGIGRGRHPLFVARDGARQRQVIVAAPAVALAPGGGYMVLFGTGARLDPVVPATPPWSAQSFYAVRDGLASSAAQALERADLAPRVLASSGAAYAISGADIDVGAAGDKPGWYFDFPLALQDGERSASATLLAGTLVITSATPAVDSCSAVSSRNYIVDALSGLAFGGDGRVRSGAVSGQAAGGAAAGGAALLPTATGVGARSGAGSVQATRTYALISAGSDGLAHASQDIKVTLPAKRISWREVANWQELHDAAR
jgi:type IV pilus assembly protein PilY1